MGTFGLTIIAVAALALIFAVCVFLSNAVDWTRLHPSARIPLRFVGGLNVFVVYCLMTFPLVFIFIGPALASASFRGGWNTDPFWGFILKHLVSISISAFALLLAAFWAWKGLIPRKFKDGTALKVMIGHILLLAASSAAAYVSVIPAVRVELGLGQPGDAVIFWFVFVVFPVAFLVWLIGLALVYSSAA